MATQKRGYQYRFYPTDEQKVLLAKTFGCVRYIWNWALERRRYVRKVEMKTMSITQQSSELTALKQQEDHHWLNEVSSVPLQQTLRHLNEGYHRLFAGLGRPPRFKCKSGEQKARFTSNSFTWKDGKLTLAKMKEPLNIHWSRWFTGEPSSVTITLDPSGRYFVSFQVEEEVSKKDPAKKTIGIDMGLTHAIVTSDGEKKGNPQFFRKDEKRLVKAQRALARKEKGSRNYKKARRKVAKLHARISDRRRDFTHKLTTELVDKNQVICIEDLNVQGMVKNGHLAKSIYDIAWGEFKRQLKYKAEWYGRTVIIIDRWFPSSKICSECGHKVEEMPLHIREWTCPSCNSHRDRDINAAINILQQGLELAG